MMANYQRALQESGAVVPMDKAHMDKVVNFLEGMATKLQEPPTALFLDDSEDEIDVAKLAFSQYAVKVTYCSDAESAMKLIGTVGYDVIFTDIIGVSGDDMIEKVLGLKPNEKFVAVTGHPSSAVVSRAIRRGALMVLPKPLSSESLELFFRRKQTPPPQ